jgi:hypothetical protein
VEARQITKHNKTKTKTGIALSQNKYLKIIKIKTGIVYLVFSE